MKQSSFWRELRFELLVGVVLLALLSWIIFRAVPEHDAGPPPAPQGEQNAGADGGGSAPQVARPGASVESEVQSATSGSVDELLDSLDEPYADARRRMIRQQLWGRNISDQRVLEAMARVPRHEFVDDRWDSLAYADQPLPIGHEQTISQPYVVALMTQLVRPTPDAVALDVGTGSGYQAAVLAEICREVYSIEIVEPLAEEARQRLDRLGYENVTVRHGDGYQGWPEAGPFDAIVVAAAPDHVPQPLVDQLKPGGRLVIPVGRFFQNLQVIEKDENGNINRHSVSPVRFVPMTGEAEEH